MNRAGPAERVYRWLWRVYPPAFRARYQADAVELFRDRLRAEIAAGRPWSLIRFWMRTVANVIVHGTLERWNGIRGQSADHRNTGRDPIGNLGHDIRFALRTFRRQPSFVLVVVLTLGLGIGANTAIFSVLHGVLLRPLPFPDPDRLVMVWESSAELGLPHEEPAPGNVLDWQARSRAIDAISAWFVTSGTVRTDEWVEEVTSGQVTTDFFRVLGVAAAIGRTFHADEVAREGRAVVLSDRLWRRRFGADSSVVGRAVTISGASYRVVGVMPPDFRYPNPEIEMWGAWDLRLGYQHLDAVPRDWRFTSVTARLRPGATRAEAERDLNRIAADLAAEFPATNGGWGVVVTSLREELVGDARPALLVVFGSVGLLLLMACANVANLLLARMPGRARELTLRTALGATRGRVVQQLLTESAVLAGLGAAVGLAVAAGLLRLLAAIDAGTIPRLDGVRIDAVVLGFTGIVALATSLVFGVVPAIYATGSSGSGGGHAAVSRAGGTAKHHGLRDTFLAVEVALALIVLLGAGLFTTSFLRLRAVDPGFDARNVVTMRLSRDPDHGTETTADFYARLVRDVARLPDVISAGAVTALPLDPLGNDFNRAYRRPGEQTAAADAAKIQMRMATADYFATMGIQLLDGPGFTGRERPDQPWVAVVNETLARRLDPEGRAVGKRLEIDFWDGWQSYTVVGIARDTRHYGLRQEPRPAVFLPHTQFAYVAMNVVARTGPDPSQVIASILAGVRVASPTQPAHRVRTVDQILGSSVAEDRFLLVVLAAFAIVAMALATSGVYGLISYAVSERTREIGVRLALGEDRATVLRRVLAHAAGRTTIGLAAGATIALVAGRAVETLLYDVHPRDPTIFVAVAGGLFAVALVAAYVPARRAARVDPIQALRHE